MKKIIITALILISIISCSSGKSEKTNNSESNNNNEIYQGYASNNMWNTYKTTMLEEEEKLFNEIDSIKDKKSFDEWQSKNPSKSSLVFAIDKFPTEEKAIELISYGADVNMKDDNRTPLKLASEKGYLKLVKELIKQGADVNFREEYQANIDALYSAVESEKNYHFEVVKELLNAGAGTDIIYGTKEENEDNILYPAIKRCGLEKVKLLTEHGADINYSNFEYGPVIAYAVSQECIDIVKYLVSQGVDPAMTYTNGYSYSGKSYSLLNAAVGNKNTEIAEYLIEQGADINTQTDSVSGLPLIFVALRAENIELLKLLIEKGADTSVVDKDGKTIFDLAKEQGYDEIAALEK
ncbi:ankyrin repeat domain-containing protein [uncultured Brachyspira sp.]|uniref:ankyrin repeat domain-containing protein n=1 Tax=uncultured Brachyspira sp. TaxID=221953 RepID=UPI0026133C5A|nr:ankyrin repeat domain-containing protein [uncultured Brachyspira sp.]